MAKYSKGSQEKVKEVMDENERGQTEKRSQRKKGYQSKTGDSDRAFRSKKKRREGSATSEKESSEEKIGSLIGKRFHRLMHDGLI